ncbi:MAG: alpha/beta hydrolase, partial [Planctomycetes bacterium]|nr:alpha/beta hydrolase [Planctomycetota bacterium]
MKTQILLYFMIAITSVCAENNNIIHLWPDKVPGESDPKSTPLISDNNKGNVRRIKKVTDPCLVVYKANPEKANGSAVVICPGGGYNILAIDLEGYEIASWLSDLGYMTFVLQYRVPKNRNGALQDGLRAMRYIRGMSKKWNIKSDRIGIMGFSAGGSLSAHVSTRYNEAVYEPIDWMDKLSARPDFTILIYPAYLDHGPNKSLTPGIKLDNNTPPMFLFATVD